MSLRGTLFPALLLAALLPWTAIRPAAAQAPDTVAAASRSFTDADGPRLAASSDPVYQDLAKELAAFNPDARLPFGPEPDAAMDRLEFVAADPEKKASSRKSRSPGSRLRAPCAWTRKRPARSG